MTEAAAPLSYANRASNLAKEQAMPLQRAPAPKKAAPAPSVTSPTASAPPSSAAFNAVTSPTNSAKPKPTPPSPSKPVTAAVSSPAAVAPSPSSSSPAPSGASSSPPLSAPVKVVKAPKTGFALVKAVTSGDTLIVIGNITQAGQQSPEKTIIVSGIAAPKFAKGKNQTDEPFAWESREYLRKKVIGQQSQTPAPPLTQRVVLPRLLS